MKNTEQLKEELEKLADTVKREHRWDRWQRRWERTQTHLEGKWTK